MNFRTAIDVPELRHKITYTDKTLFIGSCFTTNIGERMQRYKFQVNINPFGVVYNPSSIANSLQLLLDEKEFTEADLCYQNDLWFSYSHHSLFSSSNKQTCLSNINSNIQQASAFLRQANYLFITLGSAYVYTLQQWGRVVANCHKTPASEFNRTLLQPHEIVTCFDSLLKQLFQHNPHLKIIFTVSPIRHLKDGAHGNQISKACLLLAVDELQKKYSHNCFYFPAYELLLDDLRDYRFYADDMCHPSAMAVEYIWGKFAEAAIDKACRHTMDKIVNIDAACAHRPFNADTPQHKAFVQKTLNCIEQLQVTCPFMDFSDEIKKLSSP